MVSEHVEAERKFTLKLGWSALLVPCLSPNTSLFSTRAVAACFIPDERCTVTGTRVCCFEYG